MKKFLLAVLIMIIAVPAFAKDPKETVEYWKSKPWNELKSEFSKEMEKCWNGLGTHFIVPVGSKQWNICCAALAAHDFFGEITFEEVNKEMIEAKEYYEKNGVQ